MTELCHTGRGLSEEFDEDFQNRLTAYFCRDHEFLTRAGDLVVPSQFANAANAILVNMVSGYYRIRYANTDTGLRSGWGNEDISGTRHYRYSRTPLPLSYAASSFR